MARRQGRGFEDLVSDILDKKGYYDLHLDQKLKGRTGTIHEIDVIGNKKAAGGLSKSWILVQCRDLDQNIPKGMISEFADVARDIAEERESAAFVTNEALFATTAFLPDAASRTLEKRASELRELNVRLYSWDRLDILREALLTGVHGLIFDRARLSIVGTRNRRGSAVFVSRKALEDANVDPEKVFRKYRSR